MLLLDKIISDVEEKYTRSNHLERYQHIVGVAKMASFLAEKYGVDKTKAMIAAYLHDYYKYETNEELEKLVRKEDVEECQRFPFLYHAYASAEKYWQEYGQDEDIYNAIRNHVFGRKNMSILEEIILISDYTEEGRTYPSCIACRQLLLQGKFYEAIFQSTEYVISYLLKRGVQPHPLQYEVLEIYRIKKEN